MIKFFLAIIFFFITIPSFAQKQIFTTSDSVKLFITIKGQGNPCLYIHGGPGSGSYWMEKFAGDLLEKRFQMIYVDLRGVGRSTSPSDGNYSMERMILDFEEIRKHLNIEDWIIMGHSFSGTILTAYARHYPTSIRAMMMFNCSLNLSESINESWIPKALELLELENEAFYYNDSIPFQDKLNRLFPLLNERDLIWKLAFADKENERKMNETFGEIQGWNSDFGGVGLNHPDYLKNFKQFTADIEIPVLFFYGKYDWTVGPEHYKGVNFPNILFFESKVGHIPFMENKKDLKKAIDRFLKKFKL